MISRRKTWVVLMLLCFAGSLGIMAGRKPQDTGFKNLQILPKNISKARLDKEMELYSRSLGVNCGFCHVRNNDVWDYASDAKGHKREARDMMRMTNELNERYFGVNMKEAEPNVVMTCYTCHRGEEHPVIPWDTTYVKPMQ